MRRGYVLGYVRDPRLAPRVLAVCWVFVSDHSGCPVTSQSLSTTAQCARRDQDQAHTSRRGLQDATTSRAPLRRSHGASLSTYTRYRPEKATPRGAAAPRTRAGSAREPPRAGGGTRPAELRDKQEVGIRPYARTP